MSALFPSLPSRLQFQSSTVASRATCRGLIRIRHFKCALILSLAAAVLPSTALTQSTVPTPAPTPAAPAAPAAPADPKAPRMATNSAADLEYASRVALAQGVMALKQFAQKD